jgi:hypothetical protein
VPAIIVATIIGAWIVMSRTPLDNGQQITLEETATALETRAETATVVEVGEGTLQPQQPMVIEEADQPGIGTVIQPGAPQTAVINPSQPPAPPPAAAIPPPAAPAPAPQPSQSASEVWRSRPETPARSTMPPPQTSGSSPTDDGRPISGPQAVSLVRNYVVSRSFYNVENECVSVRGGTFRNEGYDVDVWDTCVRGGGSQRLGRWRVDAKTGELFRQRSDGRYLSP